MIASISTSVAYSIFGIFCILIVASLFVFLLKKRNPGKEYAALTLRIRSWWIMASIFFVAIALSRNITLVFLGFVSFLALKEYFSIIPIRRPDRQVLFWVYLSIPLQFYWVATGWYGMFIIFIPVYLFLFIPFRMTLVGRTENFLRAAGTIHWGVMAFVFSISHVAFLLVLPPQINPVAGGAGLILFLVFLTQFNDVCQYVWGKTLGKRKIIPKISPNKTWAGFIGGVVTTTVIAFVLAPYLTPMNNLHAILAGLIISIAGFIGDVTISAVKRDIGIKDSGSMIPGHGGILDRVDSLIYTAPLFFHFL
ncbi:MAG TPA: phosphatidate cytidylyltransferase, partial [Gammaproteobacteria bacterium]|nr:phosphatidate cytidylyltransferase [Gammaproteobacteria bacterium]